VRRERRRRAGGGQARAAAEQQRRRRDAEQVRLAERERATPGFPVGEAGGPELAAALLRLVPDLRRRYVVGRVLGIPRRAHGWLLVTSNWLDGTWGGHVVLEDGRLYQVPTHRRVVAPE
jgi:hypothetical protein